MALNNAKLRELENAKANVMNQTTQGAMLTGEGGYRESTVLESLKSQKSRLTSEYNARMRRLNAAISEIENTEAESVIDRAKEVLRDVAG
jgi:hypothetical protein